MSQEHVQNEKTEPVQDSEQQAEQQEGKAPEAAPAAQAAPSEGERSEVEVRANELPEWALQERKELREEAARYRTRLREQEEAARAEAERLQAEIKAIKLQADREKAATQAGLPEELVGRIQGETLEEMLADAKLLAGVRGGAGPRANGAGVTPGNPGRGEPIDPRKAAQESWKRQNRVGG